MRQLEKISKRKPKRYKEKNTDESERLAVEGVLRKLRDAEVAKEASNALRLMANSHLKIKI